MSVDGIQLSGSNAYFDRFGMSYEAVRSADRFEGDTRISGSCKNLGAIFTDLMQSGFSTSGQKLVNDLFTRIQSQRDSMSIKTDMRSFIDTFSLEMIDDNAKLTELSTEAWITELIDQMAGSGSVWSPDDAVNAPAVSVGVTAFASPTNTGNGECVASVTRPDGRTCEYVFPETIEVVITTDASTGATARSESASVTGEVAISNRLAFDWPGGSSASTNLTVIDCDLDATNNLLTNSDFSSFTGNVPTGWLARSGTAGTAILEETTTVLRSGSLEFNNPGTSGGQTLPSIWYSGITTWKPNQVYAFNLQVRREADTTGAFQFQLVNNSGTVITNDAGTNQVVTTNISDVTSGAFGAINGFFQTPKTIVNGTTELKPELRISTAIGSGQSVYFTDLALAEATEAYNGGPFLALFAGPSGFLVGDGFNVLVSNDLGGVIQNAMNRLFDLNQMGTAQNRLQIPSETDGSESILDDLVR